MINTHSAANTRRSSTQGSLWRRAMRSDFLPMLVSGVMLLVGIWLRAPTFAYDGPADGRSFNDFAYLNFTYSDVASLYFRDNLQTHPRPYFDYQLEYPVGTGALIYLLNFARTLPNYFLLTSVFLAVSGLLVALVLRRFPGANVWLYALSPSLALYVNLNWDLWALLLTVLALMLLMRGRDGWGAGLLAAAVWTKFFPIMLLPLVLIDRLRRGETRAVGRIAVVFAVVSALINAPLLLFKPSAWWYFFEMNQTRGREVNVWNLFDRWGLTTEQINRGSALLVVIGLIVIGAMLWFGGYRALPLACCAILAWFFFANKVYSPQYSLWIVVLLAAAGAAPALAVAWSAADLLYFAGSFLILGLTQIGEDSTGWFFNRALMPAMIIRESMLVLVVGWCLWRMRVKRDT